MRRAVFFFLSSRRRHTRWPRDWSSDVCSSDLVGKPERDDCGGGGDHPGGASTPRRGDGDACEEDGEQQEERDERAALTGGHGATLLGKAASTISRPNRRGVAQ